MFGIANLLSKGSYCATVQKYVLLHQSAIVKSAVATTSSSSSKTAIASKPDRQTMIDAGQAVSVKQVESLVKEYSSYVTESTKRWHEVSAVYFGKERDLVNYPLLKSPEYHPKVRMGVIPDAWFQAFYNKTGVTGPYLFGFGTVMFLMSKEIWVVDHEFMEIIPFAALMVFLVKKVGKKLSTYLEKESAIVNNALYIKPMEKMRSSAQGNIATAEKNIAMTSIVKDIFQVKRENIDFQLEAVHRERFDQINKAVRARLDYQVERDSARRQFQHQYMLNWVVDNAMKAVTPQLEKETLQQCIKDLRVLASKVQTAAV